MKALCKMTLEDLEYTLPIRVQRREKKKMSCCHCEVEKTVTYEQRIWRFDSYSLNNKKTRTYEISFYDNNSDKYLFKTDRHRTFREVLIEAHKMLTENGQEVDA